MQWENLTSTEFKQAVDDTGVCILSCGVLEKHSEHLPLGTDVFVAHNVSCMAAERESAVVFPPFYFGQIYEARCFPGTLTIEPKLLLALFQSVLDEIGRNGFKKIILFNGHGGNNHLLRFIAQSTLWEKKPYTVYLCTDSYSEEENAAYQAIVETDYHGHACECETSKMLAVKEETVKMDKVVDEPALPLKRMDHVRGSFLGISWYANQPDHYAGDARPATKEKGEALRELMVTSLANFIKAVKEDKVAPALEKEFHAKTRH